ncbi:hypothetical protein [Streptomyces luteolus]|uniref:Transposase n=1 Tax=Streptomyces luteolus TaxID=3043615 RepID=A0ABT6T8S3_9ACTN|nr:hypothetical protein [Streptomyces sp. B-S-A12]MDI3423743.1 hypothetical protein [Streptomyces sp. B-S-A12]
MGHSGWGMRRGRTAPGYEEAEGVTEVWREIRLSLALAQAAYVITRRGGMTASLRSVAP